VALTGTPTEPRSLAWARFERQVDDPLNPPASLLRGLAKLFDQARPSVFQLGRALHVVLDRLRADTLKLQPDVVAIDHAEDPHAQERAAAELERVVDAFFPLVASLVEAGAPLMPHAVDDPYILDSVVQVYSPRLIAYFLRRGAACSSSFDDVMRGYEFVHRALDDARELAAKGEPSFAPPSGNPTDRT
jgi:hypothetical protein